jgi:predicted unusual protein kinase regulating ubiquinone biosynthesis (AarF/ABC1/UbiB family)
MDPRELHTFAHQFRDLLFEMPFQVPHDYIYLGRAASILSGMCSNLYPDINYWTLLEPYAEKILREEATQGMRDWLAKAADLLGLLARLPTQADRFLGKALASELEIKVAPGRELEQDIRQLTGAINRLVWGVVFAALLSAGVALLVNHFIALGTVALTLSAMTLLGVILAGRP